MGTIARTRVPSALVLFYHIGHIPLISIGPRVSRAARQTRVDQPLPIRLYVRLIGDRLLQLPHRLVPGDGYLQLQLARTWYTTNTTQLGQYTGLTLTGQSRPGMISRASWEVEMEDRADL